MMGHHTRAAGTHGPARLTRRRGLAVLATLLMAAAAGACGSILDVDNPNNISEEALNDPSAAAQQANGVLASTSRALSSITAPYATATDELDWIGSREAWRDLELGAIGDAFNEFSDQSFPFVAEARFLGDETIRRLEQFNDSGTLANPVDLARTYLYTAVVYGMTADVFDNFVFGSRRESAAPIGSAQMVQLYDTAVVYLDRALAIADPAGEIDLQYQILATRARIKHARAVWQLVNPKGQTPANPLVNDAGANADADSALAVLPAPDDRFVIVSNIEVQPGINVFFEVNGRNEMRVGNAYATLTDPISGTLDPATQALITQFRGTPLGTTPAPTASQQGSFIVASDRELRLILAEAALAVGNLPAFTAQVNAVRALDNLPLYAGQIDALTLLKHERKANLWLQLRRLSDLYRFGEQVAEWRVVPNVESAASTPGLFFPITNVELQANTFCVSEPVSCGS
jgi:hypothetical protein